MPVVEITTCTSDELDGSTRRELRALWDRAFRDFTDDDADHAYGGVHVVARDGGAVVGHASAVERRVRFAAEPWRTVGYVEAVAVDPDRQGEGVGSRVMEQLGSEIAVRWPVAMLSTGSHGFYERLGWERWRGTSCTSTAAGVVPDHEHGGLMVLRLDASVVPDLTVTATCEDRPGDAW